MHHVVIKLFLEYCKYDQKLFLTESMTEIGDSGKQKQHSPGETATTELQLIFLN